MNLRFMKKAIMFLRADINVSINLLYNVYWDICAEVRIVEPEETAGQRILLPWYAVR
jgi:hypothetical protein